MKMTSLTLLFLLLTCVCQNANASSSGAGKHLKVEIISEQTSVKPNATAYVGFKFDLDPEWHVYWENPGDSGIPPKIIWKVPSSVKPETILWPTPEKINIPPLADYGYEKEVLFMVPLQVASPTAAQVTLEATVKWLVCRQVCIPGEAHLDLTLPVSAHPQADSRWATLFQATRLELPQARPLDLRLLTSTTAASFIFQIEEGEPLKSAQFFPREQMLMDNPSPQKLESTPKGGVLTIKKSEQLTKDPQLVSGILQIENSKGVFNYEIQNPVKPAPAESSGSWLSMIVLAFLGGLILNLMPCVFPVVSMKVFGFLKSQGEEKKHIRAHAFFYTLGILVSFWILVGVLLSLKAGGEQLGWGFQLQSPGFVGFLSGVLFIFGLSLVGVFDIGASFMGMGNSLARQSGNTGAFFTGVLATLVSTPCTAPFMGAAVGYALIQPPLVCFVIFTALALGLALPYVALSLTPSLGKFLPKPGAWMETVKQITAFLIFATVIWLLWVLSFETGASYIMTVIVGFLALSFAAWLFHRWPASRLAQGCGILIVLITLIATVEEAPKPESAQKADASSSSSPRVKSSPDELDWQEFSPAKIDDSRKQGQNVFVDFTAAWCVSCKVNELVVFRSKEVRDKLKEKNVTLLKADWTNHNPIISEALKNFGRSGVPAYALYEKNKTTGPTLLPEVITPSIVVNALNQLP